jgi:glycosyltransferase involved in cell wall biosynthesis
MGEERRVAHVVVTAKPDVVIEDPVARRFRPQRRGQECPEWQALQRCIGVVPQTSQRSSIQPTRARQCSRVRRMRRSAAPEFELVFVVAPQNRGWILDAISREIAARHDGSHIIAYGPPLPTARTYFFSHYSLFLEARRERAVRAANSVIWYTHPSYQEPNMGRHLDEASALVSGSTSQAQHLRTLGVDGARIHVIIPGADPARFTSHQRGNGAVGVCCAYYERKRPEIVAGLVAALPHRQFRLMGRGWKDSSLFGSMEAAPNFAYLEDDYENYPAFYAGVDVFVSPARLEGQPIPLLEAMMSNAVPVASDTGFARDLITPGVNGFICATDASVDDYARAVETAFTLDTDVRATVDRYSWDRFAREMLALIDQLTK